MGVQDQEMEDFKKEVRGDIHDMTNSINKLAEVMQTVVTQGAVNQEKEKHQQAFNDTTSDRLTDLERLVKEIQIERAQEKPSRDFLMKYWPWLLISMIVIGGIVSAVASGIGRSMFT